MAVQLGGKLDAADQFEACRGGERHRLVVALERVVVGDAEGGHAGANALPLPIARANNCRQIRWCASGDRSKLTKPKRSSVAQIFSTLSSGVSREEFTVTSGEQRRLVGIGNAGEMRDLSGQRALVKPFDVALGQHFDGALHDRLRRNWGCARALRRARRDTAKSRRRWRSRRCARAVRRRSRCGGHFHRGLPC